MILGLAGHQETLLGVKKKLFTAVELNFRGSDFERPKLYFSHSVQDQDSNVRQF